MSIKHNAKLSEWHLWLDEKIMKVFCVSIQGGKI